MPLEQGRHGSKTFRMSHEQKSGSGATEVVVGYDTSADSQKALEWAVNYAAATGSRLTVLAAWDWPVVLGAPVTLTAYDPQRALTESVNHALAALGLDRDRVDVIIDHGSPAALLTAASHQAALLVVGRRGTGGFLHLTLGSVSQQCLAHAACPVAIIPLAEAA